MRIDSKHQKVVEDSFFEIHISSEPRHEKTCYAICKQ